jgi:hypothetical protein
MMAGFGSAHCDQHVCNRNATIGGCEGRNRNLYLLSKIAGSCRGVFVGIWRSKSHW